MVRFSLLSTRAENLRESFQSKESFGNLQALAEIINSYIISNQNYSFLLNLNGFTQENVIYVLEQLGVEVPIITTFSNSTTIVVQSMTLHSHSPLSDKVENLRKCYFQKDKYLLLKILGDIVRSYTVSDECDTTFILRTCFPKRLVKKVLPQLNMEDYQPIVFPTTQTMALQLIR
jgi:hypothetical protein